MPRIKVTGYMDIEDDEYDDGPSGPLTQEAFEEYADQFNLEDLTFTEVK